MAKVGIKDLVSKTDEQLLDLLGYKDKVEEFKENLKEADKLEGKAREKVEDRIAEMFQPHVYPDSLRYEIERVKRAEKAKKSGKEELCNCHPDSVLLD